MMMLTLLLSTDAGGGLPGPFQPTPALAVWTVVIFAVVLFILVLALALLQMRVERWVHYQ